MTGQWYRVARTAGGRQGGTAPSRGSCPLLPRFTARPPAIVLYPRTPPGPRLLRRSRRRLLLHLAAPLAAKQPCRALRRTAPRRHRYSLSPPPTILPLLATRLTLPSPPPPFQSSHLFCFLLFSSLFLSSSFFPLFYLSSLPFSPFLLPSHPFFSHLFSFLLSSSLLFASLLFSPLFSSLRRRLRNRSLALLQLMAVAWGEKL